MSYIDWGGGDYNQGDPPPSLTPGSQPPGDVSASYGTQPQARNDDPFASQITDLYNRYGRGNPTQGEIDSNRGNPGGLSAIEALLQQDNAKAAAGQQQPQTQGGDLMSRIQAALGNAQSTDDPNYWYNVISNDPNGSGSAWNYWVDRINRGDGALGVRNGTVQKFQDGGGSASPQMPGGPNPGGYTDASSQLYLNQLLQRLQQLNTPQAPDPIEEMLKQFGLARVQSLQQPAYTQGEDAAMVTKYRDPATLARDAQKRQASEDLGRRGIGPTSGLYQTEMAKRDNSYTQAIAQGDNALAVQAVQENQRRQDQALSILNSLVGLNQRDTDRQNALRDQAVSVAQGFPNFDNQRLSQLLQASGSDANPASLISSITGLGNLNLSSINANNANSANNSAAWGKILAAILGGL